jgi:hypothetical protein
LQRKAAPATMLHQRERAMWPFDRRRQKDVEAFARALGDKGATSGQARSLPHPAHDTAHIIVVMLRDDDLRGLPDLFAKLFDCVHRHDGLVEGVMSSLALITLGSAGTERRCFDLALDLRDVLGADAKILYGATERLHGLVGISGRSCYGSFLPGFAASLRRLDQADFGEVIEFI